MSKADIIKAGITQGDINGIGYEVIIKTLMEPRTLEFCIPVVYGASKIASYHRKMLDAGDFNFNLVKGAEFSIPKRANIVNVYDKDVKIDIGQSTEIAGQLSLISLESAVNDLQTNKISVLITAPINKDNIQAENFKFPGHSEYLAQKFNVNANDFLMLLVSGTIRVGVATGHIPLRKVSETLNAEIIHKKLLLMNESLKVDFAITRPKIAVLGLNPHAGDNGILGTEESEIISPAINRAKESNILAFGPYPADGFFGSGNFAKFDGILAMYHDQGLTPFKAITFDSGVNFTAGLPIVRTSPAHGCAYDIAGQNLASPESFRAALYMACDIFRNRKMYKEINANPLKTTILEKE
jgi:4-hydroxythreonine-4-phosphate dehydrogenase